MMYQCVTDEQCYSVYFSNFPLSLTSCVCPCMTVCVCCVRACVLATLQGNSQLEKFHFSFSCVSVTGNCRGGRSNFLLSQENKHFYVFVCVCSCVIDCVLHVRPVRLSVKYKDGWVQTH